MSVETQVLLGTVGIFLLRILGVSISTIRLLLTVQGRRLLSSGLGFIEALVFALAIGSVVSQLDNIWYLSAYCLGFAVGIYVGLALEGRFITNFVTVTVVSVANTHELAMAVREAGYGATESWGHGADGLVGAIRVVCERRDMQRLIETINRVSPEAFITVDETRAVRRGYLRVRPVR